MNWMFYIIIYNIFIHKILKINFLMIKTNSELVLRIWIYNFRRKLDISSKNNLNCTIKALFWTIY
jgi:hypothetical protein